MIIFMFKSIFVLFRKPYIYIPKKSTKFKNDISCISQFLFTIYVIYILTVQNSKDKQTLIMYIGTVSKLKSS